MAWNCTGLACLLLGSALAAVTAPVRGAAPPPLEGLDPYVRQTMEAWDTPGLALAVVKNGKVVYAHGYGVREVGKADRVDTNTLFAIASNTKAFTVVSLGMLADRGKIAWDDRVTGYLPGFRLHDPYPTRELTIRDLLTHRSGICDQDFLWYATDLTRGAILRRLQLVKPHWSFRSHFCYSNNMYMAAGQIIPAVTGESWAGFVHQHILAPLGMNASATSITELAGGSDIATPHAKVDGRIVPIRWLNVDNVGPAGAINSSVNDMSHWLEMLLADGQYKNQRLVSTTVIREMEIPQMVIRADDDEGRFLHDLNPDAHSLSYGLAFFMDDYRGQHIVWHSGHIDGMSAALGMIPSLHLGVVVLSNMNQSWLPVALMHRIFDAWLGAPKRDWSADLLAMTERFEHEAEAGEARMQKAQNPASGPSLPLGAYVGTYADPLYGRAIVTLESGNLVLRRNAHFIGDLIHWDHDTFRLRWRYRFLGHTYATFHLGPAGSVRSVQIAGLGVMRKSDDTTANAS